jgi:hypothetical protein
MKKFICNYIWAHSYAIIPANEQVANTILQKCNIEQQVLSKVAKNWQLTLTSIGSSWCQG